MAGPGGDGGGLGSPLRLDEYKRWGAVGMLVALFALNPLTYSWNTVAGGLFPDSLLYLVMSDEIVERGRAFVAGWGHVDTGVVLPPVYPTLVGVTARLGGDGILASYWVSTGALLLAVLPWFFLVRRQAGEWCALLAVAAVQLHASNLIYATAALTEGVFILGLSALALWTMRVLERPRALEVVALGAGAALLFLTRQIGLFYLPVLLVLLAAGALSGEGPRFRVAAARMAMAGLGFLAVLSPYSAVLYAQTGQSPFVQHFRLNLCERPRTLPGHLLCRWEIHRNTRICTASGAKRAGCCRTARKCTAACCVKSPARR